MSQPSVESIESAPLRALPGQAARAWRVAVPLTSILGREDEIGAVAQLLDRDGVRLVTVTGPGGIGKTRLAREVAVRMQGDFAHGACFVSLAAVADPEPIAAAAATALGLQLLSDRPASELLVEALHDRHLLLVLDNLEHLAEAAAPWIASVLEQCPRVSALATSRVPLRLAGEHRFAVEPLAVSSPSPGLAPDVERLAQSAAVALFAERARSAAPDFSLKDTNVAAVAEICRMLDGLPLAIELAAAQIRLLPPRHLLDRLRDRLSQLHSDQRDAPARHRTMRDAIAWGYDLLDPGPRRLFRWLSVFAGGFPVAAAEAIATAAGIADGQDALLELVEHSFLRRREQGPDGYRFGMLEVVREYGAARLAAADEREAARDAHAAWVLRLARDAERRMAAPEQVEWLDRLEQEHDNIRRAIAWLTERERIEEALDLTGSLWFFRWIRGYYAEGRDQFERLLAHPGGAARTVPRAKALIGLGIIASHQGDPGRTLPAFEEAIDILREHDAQEYLPMALACYGTAYLMIGRIDECEAHLVESRRIAEATGDAWVVQATLANLGVIAMQRGQWDLARERMEESLRMSRSLGDRWGLALGISNLGYMDLREGKTDSAEAHLLHAARLIEELGDKRDLPGANGSAAEIARQRGELQKAKATFTEALDVARDIGDWMHIAEALKGLARVVHAEGDPHAGIGLVRDAMRTLEQSGDRIGAVLCLDDLADMALVLGDARHAGWCIGAVDGVLERSGQSRQGTMPGEHQARVDAAIRSLGEDGWREVWAEGHALDDDAILAQAFAWQPPPPYASAYKGRVAPALTPPDTAPALSPRELEVLRLMADGLTNQEIADRLYLSHRTATSHTSNILGKLGLTTRTAAVAYAIRHGIA